MSKRAAWTVERDEPGLPLVIADSGCHADQLTVTNDAERVVAWLMEHGKLRGGRRLFYYDSEGDLGELLRDDQGHFKGYGGATEADLGVRTPAPAAKPNCYECKHRGPSLGSVHSTCRRGEKQLAKSVIAISTAAQVRAGQSLTVETPDITVKGSWHGWDKGWFAWPVDFDPVWLESCTGFEPKGRP